MPSLPQGASHAGLILTQGAAGRCDDYRLGGAVVDRDPASGIWRMWYYCRDRAFVGPPTLGTGRVAMALSDDGVVWRRFDGPFAGGAVFVPASDPACFDSLHLGVSDVTRLKHGLLMWYFGGDARPRACAALGQVPGLGMRPGLARSRDGVHWKRAPGLEEGNALLPLPADRVYAAWPNAFHDGRDWFLQVTEASSDLSSFRTSVWRAPDACAWQAAGELVFDQGACAYDAGGCVTRQVMLNPLPDGRRFLMIYTGVDNVRQRSIAAADSDDGLVWHRLYGEPIFGIGNDGAWDSLGVASPRLVAAEGQLHLYYYGFQSLGADEGLRGIGLATAPVGDLRRLRRWHA